MRQKGAFFQVSVELCLYSGNLGGASSGKLAVVSLLSELRAAALTTALQTAKAKGGADGILVRSKENASAFPSPR